MRWFIGLTFMGFAAGLVLGIILMTIQGESPPMSPIQLWNQIL